MPHSHRRLAISLASVGLVLTVFTATALAQTSDKLRTGDSVTIPAGETVSNDLYAFAGTVRVDGTVDGDLVATGGSIDITGTVTGDVLAAGGNVSISGTVGGDARIAGGTLNIDGAVSEDLVASGGRVTISPSGTVGEDALVWAGQLAVDGAVAGDLTARVGTYAKTGTVGGTEDVQITSGPGQPSTPAPEQTVAGRAIDAVQHFLVVLAVGGVLIWLVPRGYAAMKTAIQRRPLPAAGWGILGLFGYFVALIVIVLAMVLLAILFGTLGFGDLVGVDVLGGIVAILGVTLAFVIACAYVADAIVGAALAGLILREASATRTREFGLLAAGAAVVVLLSSLPVLGPWVKLVVVVLGLGALLLVVMQAWRPPPPEPVTWSVPPQTPTG
jgi:cytoskeletal protein CcmA (bactofilin family)